MGWCHEFGPQIREGCGHPMAAGAKAEVGARAAKIEEKAPADVAPGAAVDPAVGRVETRLVDGVRRRGEELRSDATDTAVVDEFVSRTEHRLHEVLPTYLE